jgi:putative transposase
VAPFISAEQFGRVYALLRQERKIHTKERETVRRFLEAVFWINRSGAQWRFLPTEYGEWNSVYTRFARWDDLGVWGRLFDQVADDPDLQAVLVDSTVVRAHACAAGAPKKTAGRRRRGSGARGAGSAPRSTPSSTRSAIR